jgi:hypothetical protein
VSSKKLAQEEKKETQFWENMTAVLEKAKGPQDSELDGQEQIDEVVREVEEIIID